MAEPDDERARAPASSPSGGRSSSACASRGSSRSRTTTTAAPRSPSSARRTRASPTARRPTTPTGSPAGSRPAAARARRPSSTSSTRTGKLQVHARRDVLGADELDALVGLDLGDIVGVEGTAFKTRRGELSLKATGWTLLAKSLRPPPDKFHGLARHRASLPPPRARPDRQPRGARAVSQARPDDRRDPRVPRLRGLRRGRDAGPAAALRRRPGAAVHHPPQRARPRPLPADRDRALPEALRRRRDRARLRARQGLPQRGGLVQAQPRVHDARVVRGLRRLRGRGGAARGAGRPGRRAGQRDDQGRARRGRDRAGAALAAGHPARRDPRADRDRRARAPDPRGAGRRRWTPRRAPTRAGASWSTGCSRRRSSRT